LADLYRFLAYTKQQKLEFEAAIENLDNLLAIMPNDEAALNLKFSILNTDIGDQERAYNVLKEYAEVTKDVNAYITLANGYRDNKNNTEAEKYYLIALELKNDAATMLIVADFYRSISEWNKATEIFERVLATNPDQEMKAAVQRRIGENYSQAGNNSKMIEAFEKYLALERDAQIALLLASQFNTAKNYNKVVQYATMVIGLDSSNSDAYMLRGLAYYNLKRMNEAKADFTRIENDPRHGANAKKFLAVIK
jgi:tetratricopeptide (TPR) repeat protein